MNSNEYTNQFLDTIDMVVENAISKANFDRTVQATISKVQNTATGEYTVRYQGGVFSAYASNPDTDSYTRGQSVYVQIPGNDTSKKKIILGTVDRLGEGYVISEEEAEYSYVGDNIVDKNNIDRYGLHSYLVTDEVILYDKSTGANPIGLNVTSANQYLKHSNYLIVAAKFQTILDASHRAGGNFGLEYTLVFKDSITGTNKNMVYTLDVNQMGGNPYTQTIPTRQYVVFDIDSENFVEVSKIRAFSKDFVTTSSTHDADIFVNNVELLGANAVEVDESTGFLLKIITEDGTYFTSSATPSELKLKTEIIKNGKVQSNQDEVIYYWFKENNQIYYNSEKYNKYGGQGWECLNTINTLANGEKIFLEGKDYYIVSKTSCLAKEQKYKCVVVYDKSTVLSREVTIYNLACNFEISLSVDGGTGFSEETEKNITCTVYNSDTSQQSASPALSDYKFSWTRIIDDRLDADSNWIIEQQNASNVETKENINYYNYILAADTKPALRYIKYQCTVYHNNGTSYDLIGNASITLIRQLTNGLGLHAVLQNGSQVIKYNENGVSPVAYADTDFVLLPITFKLYDDDGEYIEYSKIGASNITWSLEDSSNTLIKGITISGDFNESVSFGIKETYNVNKTKNQIKLLVKYDGKEITTITDLVFLKEGDLGSNGTEYVCKLRPNSDYKGDLLYIKESNSSSYKILDSNNELHDFNNSSGFVTELYKNGIKIYTSTTDSTLTKITTYKMQINKYGVDEDGNSIEDASNFTINSSTGILAANENLYFDHAADIVRAEVNYEGSLYYATYPIIVVQNTNGYNMLPIYNSGFRFGVYQNDGTNPQWDKIVPFKVKACYGTTELTSGFTWAVKGDIKTKNTPATYDTNYGALLIDGSVSSTNTQNYILKDKYNGYSVNNAVYCKNVDSNNDILTQIHIPVQVYLNRYGNSAMNTWDGNSISIKESEGAILAPQVGAGKKETDNSFTGVFMGNVKQAGNDDVETGLFGYKSGERTISLNAEDGTAKFGKSGKGQICLVPDDDDHAYLRSGNFALVYEQASGQYLSDCIYFRKSGDNYTELKAGTDYIIGGTIGNNIYKMIEGGSGLEIDLTDPHIRFGSGNLIIDSSGNIYANKFATTGMMFNQSSVDGLTTRLGNVDTSITELGNSIDYLQVFLPTNNLTKATDANRIPITTTEVSLDYTATYKGNLIGATATTSNSYGGITVSTSLDSTTKIGTITFSFTAGTAIQNQVNTYTFSFKYSGKTITKEISVVTSEKGNDGTSVTIKGTYEDIAALCAAHPSGNTAGDGYILNNNSTTTPIGTGEKGHLFVYTNAAHGSGSLYGDWEDVGKIKGDDGQSGKGVSSVVNYYYLSTSSTEPTGGSWSSTIPAYTGGYYWTKIRTTYTDSTSNETDPVLDNALTTANQNASTANTNASNAVSTANTANANASSAVSTASSAVSTANTASSKADSAISTANSADEKADNAVSTADSAVSTANNANTKADSAVSTANTANTNASNAVSTANTANTNASNALSKANSSVKSEQIHYLAYKSNTGVTTSTSGWTTTIQTITADKKYLWTYITYTKADNSTVDSTPVVSGVYGDKGENAGSVSIYSDRQQFIYDKNGTVDIETITLNSTSSGAWYYYNGTDYILIGTSSSIVVANNNTSYFYNSGKVAKFKIEATVNSVSCSDYYSVYKIYNGEDGTDGKQIQADGETIQYQNSTSGTEVPEGEWSSSPNPVVGQYTWVKTTQYYKYDTSSSGSHDAGSTISYSVSYTGTNGTNGKEIVADRTVNTYQNSTSGTVVPTGSWSDTPSPTKGQYLWTKITTYYRYSTTSSGTSDAGSTVSYSVSYEGTNGTNGTSPNTVYLTNENISFTADKDGKVPNTLTFTSNVVAYSGSTKTTPTVGTPTGGIEGELTISVGSVTNNEIPITITIVANKTLGSASSTQGEISIPITSPVSTTLKLNWSKINTGATGEKGNDGVSPYQAYLTNEAQTFAAETAQTITTSLYGYQGTIEKTVQIISINGKTPKTDIGETGITGINFKVSSVSATSHPLITFETTTSLPQTQSGQIPIVYKITGDTANKTLYFSYSTTTKGAKGDPGSTGEGAKLVDLTSSSQMFKSTDGGTTFSPDNITLTARLQNVTAGSWQYSTDGGTTWYNASGQEGLTISGEVLIINKGCPLYTSQITSIQFKYQSGTSSIYDTITIFKVYDVTDIELGGRNLILKSRDFTQTVDDETYWDLGSNWTIPVEKDEDGFSEITYSRSGSSETVYDCAIPKKYLTAEYINKASKGIMVSFDLKLGSTTLSNNNLCSLVKYNSSGTVIGTYLTSGTLFKPALSTLTTDTWTRITCNFTQEMLKAVDSLYSSSDISYIKLRFHLLQNGDIHIKRPKMEIGNIATDWSAAIEDSEDEISNNASLLKVLQDDYDAYIAINNTNISTLQADTLKSKQDILAEREKLANETLERITNYANGIKETFTWYASFDYTYTRCTDESVFDLNLIYYTKSNDIYTKARIDKQVFEKNKTNYYIRTFDKDSKYVEPSQASYTSGVWSTKYPSWNSGKMSYKVSGYRTYGYTGSYYNKDGNIVSISIASQLVFGTVESIDYGTLEDERYKDATSILLAMRNKDNKIWYDASGLYIYNTKETNRILMCHEGISFGTRGTFKLASGTYQENVTYYEYDSVYEHYSIKTGIIIGAEIPATGVYIKDQTGTLSGWDDNSVWTVDGKFDAKTIQVENLTAEDIQDGILTLGNDRIDGSLIIKQTGPEPNIITKMSSRRTIYNLNNNDYIAIGKDIGLQYFDSNGKKLWGNTIEDSDWTTIPMGSILLDNVNYYTSQNLKDLVDDDLGGKTSERVYYTVKCRNTYSVTDQKVTNTVTYGKLQTLNISTSETIGNYTYNHEGIAFVKTSTS